MKNDKFVKFDLLKLKSIQHITEYLDYRTIYELYHTSNKISYLLEELKINNRLDLRQQNLNNDKIEIILTKSKFKYENLILEFKDIGDKILDLFTNNIIELNLNGCHKISDEGLLKLTSKIKNLRILELYWMPQLTDKSISIILKNCPKLMILNLSGCKNLTDKSLKDINILCPLIQKTDFTRCSSLTSTTFSNVCMLKDLKYLNLYALANLKCDFFTSLSTNFTCKLEFFDICGNLHITDEHLKQCGNILKNLKYLNLSWCINITDEGLKNLITEFYQLELLSLHGILGITDNTVNLMKTNKNLVKTITTLDLYGCANIKNKDKEFLKNIFLFIKIFKYHT